VAGYEDGADGDQDNGQVHFAVVVVVVVSVDLTF
jgi:hypothetical protein